MLMVTGAAGFIGGCFTRMLANEGTGLCLIDALTYAGNLMSIEGPLSLVSTAFTQCDIGDRAKVLEQLHTHKCSAIINFAAESHVDRSIDNPDCFVETNVLGTVRLLNAALDYWRELDAVAQQNFRFLHVSTDEVYGSLGESGSFSETSKYAPNSPYAASKAASDHFVRAYHHTYGLPVLITNCSNNYGPYQFPEKLIPLMILNAVARKPLPVYGDGQQIRDWLHVEDHCRAIRLVLERGRVGEVYNIGGGTELTNLQVVQTICDHVAELSQASPAELQSLITHVVDRPGHDRRYAIDSSKIRQELGWAPTYSFPSGLRETVQWYLQNDVWVDRVRSGAYRRIGLSTSLG
jgi:dTDP-glucose 4,6-dehydratase